MLNADPQGPEGRGVVDAESSHWLTEPGLDVMDDLVDPVIAAVGRLGQARARPHRCARGHGRIDSCATGA